MARPSWSNQRLGRRSFLAAAGGVAAALLGTRGASAVPTSASAAAAGYGPLIPDAGGILDLPRGFQYRIVSPEGARLSNGAPVPGNHDGMGAFPGPGGTTILVRNHELAATQKPAVVGKNPYDRRAPGGTTAIVVGANHEVIQSYVTSSGTRNNCAGGATPWGTWLTCEEDRTTRHGYVFEVMPDDPENALAKTPILAMGFFAHEAVGIDPRTGIVYLTEDDYRGRIHPRDPSRDTRSSFLYRYIPHDRGQRPGALQQGGRPQALTIVDRPRFGADFAAQGQRFQVGWVDVNPAEPHDSALTRGAVRFNRLEGAHFAGGAFWFADTAGGEQRLGQIYRYLPASETLELFYEGTDANKMESLDNIVITPWGDLWFAEDGAGENRLMGITPDGQVYTFARNRLNGSELAGPCFAPDGQTCFVNIQDPGLTFVIWGSFMRRTPRRRYQLSQATPPSHLAPSVSGDLLEAAARYGLSPLAAAAYHRFGVPLI